MSARDQNAALDGPDRDDIDPDVAEFLRECDQASGDVSADDLQSLLSSMESQLTQSESGTGGWLKSRSTGTRRALSFGSFLALAGLALLRMRGRGVADLPAWAVGVCLGSLGVLIALSLWTALRPLQAPALSHGKVGALALLSVGCAVIVAFVPGLAQTSAAGTAHAAAPCMYAGLLFGLPVYALARVLDRGPRLSSILAASAAGLTGNFILALDCPNHGREHMLVGHASVVLIFLLGVFAVHAVESRLRRRG